MFENVILIMENVPFLWIITCAVLGGMAGSFAGLAAWRYKRSIEKNTEADLVSRSKCEHCGRLLGFMDLVPVLGWIFRKGRCPDCGTSVSCVYPIMESLCALCYVCIGLVWGPSYTSVFIMLASALFISAAWTDWETYGIPDSFTLILILMGLLASPFTSSYAERVWGMFIPAFLMFILMQAGSLIKKKDMVSPGDIYMLAAGGAVLGVNACAAITILSCLVFVLYAVPARMMRVGPRTDAHFIMLGDMGEMGAKAAPMGPALALSTIILMLNPTILNFPFSDALNL